MQVEKAAWKLQHSFASAQFQLSTYHGGAPLEHPRVVLIQALATHIQQLTALPDMLREATIRGYRRLCIQKLEDPPANLIISTKVFMATPQGHTLRLRERARTNKVPRFRASAETLPHSPTLTGMLAAPD